MDQLTIKVEGFRLNFGTIVCLRRAGCLPTSPAQQPTSARADVPISELAVANLPTLDFSPSVRPKKRQGLFPAPPFPAPCSSAQELKSSSETEVTEAVATVLE